MSIGGDTSTNGAKSKVLNPLEVNGITAVTLGTVVWAVALIALLFLKPWLDQTGRTNWIWIALSGLLLGGLGHRYTTNREKRFKNLENSDQSMLIQDFE